MVLHGLPRSLLVDNRSWLRISCLWYPLRLIDRSPRHGAQRRDEEEMAIAPGAGVGPGLGLSLAEAGGAQRDRQAVVDLADTGRRPCRAFRYVTLVPGLDFASEDHPSTVGPDGDPRSIDLSTPLQRPLDLLLNL